MTKARVSRSSDLDTGEAEDGRRNRPMDVAMKLATAETPLAAGSTVWWENGFHHYKSTQLSGYVTGSGLLRLCIAPSTTLNNLSRTASDTYDPEISPITYQSSALSFFSLLFLSSSQSTILLQLLPPYTPRNETSIFVASYGSYRVRSPDPGFPPHMVL